MTELEIMKRAKMYIDKLANGINPLDDTPVADSDVVNNVRISRCLFYVSGVLDQVIGNGGTVGRKRKKRRTDFTISDEQLAKYVFPEAPVPLSEITHQLNELADLTVCGKMTYRAAAAWLVEIGVLAESERTDGKKHKVPTEQGRELGIASERREGVKGEYSVVTYNREAQQFILDNLQAIVEHSAAQEGETA